jgi:acyl carrier protein
MVPAAIVVLPQLPLSPNGKVDRKVLPAPDALAYSRSEYEPPKGEIETVLAVLWAEALKLDRVGRKDNFFELGGHSLMAVRMVTRIQQKLKIEIGIRDLFLRPVLADLAQSIKTATHAKPPSISRARRKERLGIITATSSSGGKIASKDNGLTWFDLQTGKAIQ